jgi:uncharacterized membrane protein
MGCYYHPAVPTAVLCRECGQEICAHCSVDSVCPGCRLGHAIKSAQQQPVLVSAAAANGTGATNGTRAQSSPGSASAGNGAAAAAAPPKAAPSTAAVIDEQTTPEDRLLSALCYPLWPIALIVLFLQSKRSKFLRFNVVQSLGVNALGVLLYVMYAAAQHIPVIGWQSAIVLPFAMPIWFFIDLFLGVKAYGGQTTHVPIAADIATKFAA